MRTIRIRAALLRIRRGSKAKLCTRAGILQDQSSLAAWACQAASNICSMPRVPDTPTQRKGLQP